MYFYLFFTASRDFSTASFYSPSTSFIILITELRIPLAFESIIINIIIIIIISGSAAQRGLWPPRFTKFLDHKQRRHSR
jgi:cell division protein FtsW (lipid II flippase)